MSANQPSGGLEGRNQNPVLANAEEILIALPDTAATYDSDAAANIAGGPGGREHPGPTKPLKRGTPGPTKPHKREYKEPPAPSYEDPKDEERDSYDSYKKGKWPRNKEMLDLSVTVALNLPCSWPSPFLPPVLVNRYVHHGPGPYASEALVIDEHTGTHWDGPTHFIPPPSTGLPNAADIGNVNSERIPAGQFLGEACVIDVRKLLNGSKPITTDVVQAWEQAHRDLSPGDAVLFRSGYSDKYYKPFPAGRRYVDDPLQGAAPPWSGVAPDCMAYLVGKKVAWVGIDAPNIGPASADAIATHVVGLGGGALLIENLINLGSLTDTGAFVAILGPKHANGSGGEARVVAIKAGTTATELIRSTKLQQVVDLSVLMREDLPVWWPGAGVGNYRCPYISRTLHSWEQPGGPALVRNHILDGQSGTHVVPPSYSVPRTDFDYEKYDEETRKAIKLFEDLYGPLGSTTTTADRIPVEQLAGPAHIIDVKHLAGTAAPGQSPVIRTADIHRHEKYYGRIRSGDVVIFNSGYSDRFFQPFPYGSRCIADPINGQAEGWPAPEPETIIYLEAKGVRCVGTDAPRMGATDPKKALYTYWAGGSREMCFVEYLTSVGDLPPTGSYFLFAPVKVKRSNGGYGRAIALF
jgi:kynurenine formamidase